MKFMGNGSVVSRSALLAFGLVLVVVVFGSASGVRSQGATGVQYKVVNATELLADREALEQELNGYGEDGWELVHIVDRSALRVAVSAQVQDLLILKK